MSNIQFRLNSNEASQFVQAQNVAYPSGAFQPVGLLSVVAASATLTDDQLRTARDSVLFVDYSGGAVDLSLPTGGETADSHAHAAHLISVLGLSRGEQCVLRFASAGATIAAESDLNNGAVVHANVDIQLHSATGEASHPLFRTSAAASNVPSSGVAYVVATPANTTPGSERILIDIRLQGASANA